MKCFIQDPGTTRWKDRRPVEWHFVYFREEGPDGTIAHRLCELALYYQIPSLIDILGHNIARSMRVHAGPCGFKPEVLCLFDSHPWGAILNEHYRYGLTPSLSLQSAGLRKCVEQGTCINIAGARVLADKIVVMRFLLFDDKISGGLLSIARTTPIYRPLQPVFSQQVGVSSLPTGFAV